MSDDPMQDKWDQRYRQAGDLPGEPTRVLGDFAHLLPRHGQALDLASGLGANALFLARHGLETWAWDLSTVAMDKLSARAGEESLPLHAEVRDVIQTPPSPLSFDVIVVAHFLERDLAPHLIHALRPGGLLFFQTFTRTFVNPAGPSQEIYRLADNELLSLFTPLQLIAYREEGSVGDTSRGFRDEAMLVGLKVAG